MAESIPKQNLSTLLKKKYINLTTYRKNGEGVSTPVIFALFSQRKMIKYMSKLRVQHTR